MNTQAANWKGKKKLNFRNLPKIKIYAKET